MPSTGDNPCPNPAVTLFLIAVYLCPCFGEASGCCCDRVCSVLGYLCELLGRDAEHDFPRSVPAAGVCAFIPQLAPLSLVLIPLLGFILQPRWFQGVSCCLVNPCPALSCRNLPQQLGCGGNLLREVPGCSPLQARGQDQGRQLGTGGRSTPGFILSGYKKKKTL